VPRCPTVSNHQLVKNGSGISAHPPRLLLSMVVDGGTCWLSNRETIGVTQVSGTDFMPRRGNQRIPPSYLKLGAGVYYDGGNNLQLRVTRNRKTGVIRRNWIFRFKLPGRKSRDMGLGGAHIVNLALAREEAVKAKLLVRQNIDPLEHRKGELAKNLATSAASITFAECAEQFMAQRDAVWKSEIHAQQWRRSLQRYALPIIGKLAPGQINVAHIGKIFDGFWNEKPVTAARVAQRCAMIWQYAKGRGHCTGDNPFSWEERLSALYPAVGELNEVKHYAALSYKDTPAFFAKLQQRAGVGPLMLQFLMLIPVRSADVRSMRFADIDFKERVWKIAKFSKTGKPFTTPLSDAAIGIIKKARETSQGELVFAGRSGGPLAPNVLRKLIVSAGLAGKHTTHGSRSSFRTWCSEGTDFPFELGELCIGHVVADRVQRAYLRGEGLRKRIAIIDRWADFVTGKRVAAAKLHRA
jgi:integrase